jgi:hypothetical protein
MTPEGIAMNLNSFRAIGEDVVNNTALALAALVENLLDAADLAPTEHWHDIVGARMGKLREAVRRGWRSHPLAARSLMARGPRYRRRPSASDREVPAVGAEPRGVHGEVRPDSTGRERQ